MTDLSLHNSYLGLPEGVARRVMPTAVAAPRLLALNAPLARQLGFDPSELRGDAGVGVKDSLGPLD